MKHKSVLFSLYLPENLDLDAVLAEHPPKFPYTKLWFQYFIHLLIEPYAYDHRLVTEAGLGNRPFIQICAQHLNRLIKHYRQYIIYLSEMGIIEVEDSYEVSRYCKSYRLTKQYSTPIRVLRVTPQSNRVQYRALHNSLIEKQATVDRNYRYITKWLSDLQIDQEAAVEFVESNFVEEMARANTPRKKIIAIQRLNAHIMMIDRVANPHTRYSIDTAGHRLHTKLTNMSAILRPFITYKGQPLVAIDLSCSQPTLASRLLDIDFYKPRHNNDKTLSRADLPADIRSRVEHIPDTLKKLHEAHSKELGQRQKKAFPINILYITPITIRYTNTIQHHSLMVDQMVYDVDCQIDMPPSENVIFGQELQEFTESIRQGQFYEHLARRAEASEVYSNMSRKQLKAAVLTMLYSDNFDNRRFMVEARQLFLTAFPTIAQIIHELKVRHYANLPIVLQGIEAELFLNRIARRISKERPDLPIFTLHDSIITIVGQEDYVQCVMADELSKALGFQPHFKTEYWGQQ